ncbi:MAG: TetR/AcrR family transcriptional regulator [Betaproteobacteria bacterium]
MSTSKPKNPAYHHGDLSEAILQAAAEVLEEQGVEGLKMRDLARRAEVSHNAPYRHFPDRESLLAALSAEGFARLGKAQQEARRTGGLKAMGEAYVRFALEHPQRFRLMFGGGVRISRHPALRDIAKRVFDGLSGALAGQVAEASGARDASIAAWAMVHGLANLMLDDKISADAMRGRDCAAFARDVLATLRFAARPDQPPRRPS